VTRLFTSWIRKVLSDKNDNYVFTPFDQARHRMVFPAHGGLYVHVPFCENFCPYCPYYKEPFEQSAVKSYKRALLDEIAFYGERFSGTRFTSLYFGGGTPTLIINDLFDIVRHLKKHLSFQGPIALETTPTELTPQTVTQLKQLGVNLLSVGVQSFNDKHLQGIGRHYRVKDIQDPLKRVMASGFDTVNLDMIFVFPGQTLFDLRRDMDAALEFNPDQITYYPLFTFPYTAVGAFKALNALKLPRLWTRRKMYYFLHRYLQAKGFRRSSVWSFNRPSAPAYSSVTRDFYLGLGPGAGSYTREGFYFNTFSVEDYARKIAQDQPALALKMPVSSRMAKLFWLYWRLYETEIPLKEYERLFHSSLKTDFPYVPGLLRWLGFSETHAQDRIRLNARGTHWIHVLQNHFALNYVSDIWTAFQKEPFPQRVAL
jgi:oxygen-independent coproporphyrinogen-3 oxidase